MCHPHRCPRKTSVSIRHVVCKSKIWCRCLWNDELFHCVRVWKLAVVLTENDHVVCFSWFRKHVVFGLKFSVVSFGKTTSYFLPTKLSPVLVGGKKKKRTCSLSRDVSCRSSFGSLFSFGDNKRFVLFLCTELADIMSSIFVLFMTKSHKLFVLCRSRPQIVK